MDNELNDFISNLLNIDMTDVDEPLDIDIDELLANLDGTFILLIAIKLFGFSKIVNFIRFSPNFAVFCTEKRECRRCHINLSESNYADSNASVCRKCSRRHRSALDQTFHEIDLPVTSANGSFTDYI